MERARGQVSAALRAVMAPAAHVGPARACLGVQELPARLDSLAPGMVYSLACDQQAIRLPLAAGALAASLGTGKSCVLLTPGDPAMFLRKARLAGFELADYAREGSLALLQLAGEADKSMFRIGPEGLLGELEPNVGAGGALLVFDQADALFMLSDPQASAEAAQAYLRWIAAHDHTLLALFAPSAMAPREYLALRRIAENFAGFAVARSSAEGGSLEIRHWFAAEGASPRETFRLRLHGASGATRLAEVVPQDELPPVETVIAMRGALRTAASLGPDWQEVAGLEEALHAARRSESATLLLPFDRRTDFAALCRTVSALRAMARSDLRVVVRECGWRLRAAQTLALLRLGTSSVIPMEIPDAGAKRIVELLRGTHFSRPYEADLQQAHDEALCLRGSPAANIAHFCEAVEGLLAAADGLDFEACLVRVAVPEGNSSALLGSALRRGRDLVGLARPKALHLFVFGCPEAALEGMMQRLLPGTLRWEAVREPGRILVELDALRAA